MRTMTLGLLLAATALPATATAQSLAERVRAVRDGRVEFTYASREGTCGDGRYYVRMGNTTHGMTFSGRNGNGNAPCVAGPVRVVLRKAAGDVEDVRHYVGPVLVTGDSVTTRLGMVPAREAVTLLLELARTADGRPSERAILPALLADSTTGLWRPLLAIARDTATRTRGTRRTAMHFLGELASAKLAGHPDRIWADDDEESPETETKKSAVFALSQQRGGSGVPALIEIARTHRDPAVRRNALFWLGQSGDARAVGVFEEILGK